MAKKPTKEKYCLDCGETVSNKAKKCSYCGSHELDVMEIEPEEDNDKNLSTLGLIKDKDGDWIIDPSLL